MRADRGDLEMIFTNLVSNAVKYSREGGQVCVAVEGQEGTVRIAVTDTGIGMSTQEAAQLFREFIRIKNAQTRNILGSGLMRCRQAGVPISNYALTIAYSLGIFDRALQPFPAALEASR